MKIRWLVGCLSLFIILVLPIKIANAEVYQNNIWFRCEFVFPKSQSKKKSANFQFNKFSRFIQLHETALNDRYLLLVRKTTDESGKTYNNNILAFTGQYIYKKDIVKLNFFAGKMFGRAYDSDNPDFTLDQKGAPIIRKFVLEWPSRIKREQSESGAFGIVFTTGDIISADDEEFITTKARFAYKDGKEGEADKDGGALEDGSCTFRTKVGSGHSDEDTEEADPYDEKK